MHGVKSCLGKQLCLNEIHKLGGGLSISYIKSYSIIVLRGILSSFRFVENTTIRAVGSSAYRKYQDEAHFFFLPFAIVAYVTLFLPTNLTTLMNQVPFPPPPQDAENKS